MTDINIKQVEKVNRRIVNSKINGTNYSIKRVLTSKLTLEFSGKNNNNVLVNTIRRVSLNHIPIYAFPSEMIKITENNSIYNNDYMRLRLSQLPIMNTELELFTLEPTYWNNVDYSDTRRKIHPSEKRIEIAINVYNNTNQIKNVTTNDIYYTEDGEEMIKYNQECPILLIRLRPSETFKCTMRAALGVGLVNDIWASAANVYYNDHTTDDIKGNFIENKDNKITFSIESQGQFDEYDILIKSCKYIINKLNDIEKNFVMRLNSNEITNTDKVKIVLDGEDHTIGQLLNYYFQDHREILYSGVSKPDQLHDSIIFTTVCTNKIKNPIVAMIEQIKYVKDIYESIQDKITRLQAK